MSGDAVAFREALAEAEKAGGRRVAAYLLTVGRDRILDFGSAADAWDAVEPEAIKIESGEVSL